LRRNKTAAAGEVRSLKLESRILQGNLLGDPATREVRVYLPAGFSAGKLPLLVDL
jgi:hypothetical protein